MNRKDKRWLKAVGQIEHCVLCGSNEMLQVAHRNMNRGKALKAPDYETARLCRSCHFEIDSGKNLSKLERRELLHRAIVQTHSILIDREMIILCVP